MQAPRLKSVAPLVAMDILVGRVQRFTEWLDAEMVRQGRDASHGMDHFERVRTRAIELAEAQTMLSGEQSLILQMAALCHDVLDHKYSKDRDPHELAAVEENMKAALRSLGGLQEDQVRRVLLVANNISLSSELAGHLDTCELERSGLMDVRNLVSDADKLDALGITGLKRLAQYQTHRLQLQGLPPTYFGLVAFRAMAEKYLLHRSSHLRTPEGIRQGALLHRETECMMLSDAAMSSILAGVAA